MKRVKEKDLKLGDDILFIAKGLKYIKDNEFIGRVLSVIPPSHNGEEDTFNTIFIDNERVGYYIYAPDATGVEMYKLNKKDLVKHKLQGL